MKVSEILHEAMKHSYPEIHKIRLKSLFEFVESGLSEQRVSVTYLGRGLKSRSKTDKKHDIKRADRLVGNGHLHSERVFFYEQMTSQLIGHQKHPVLIVDWSPLKSHQIYQLLRVSIPMKGRSLTVYEKSYSEAQLNSPTAHQEVLDTLEEILPTTCQPIILSDALFRADWFRMVESKGWFWVGRVRGNVCLSHDNEQWLTAKKWHNKATSTPQSVGKIFYGKTQSFVCKGVLFKEKSKGRKTLKKRGGKSLCTTVKYQQKKAKEPWLLVFFLPETFNEKPFKIVRLYQQRMQVEEAFRDTKSQNYGVGLSASRSRSPLRMDNLLLIAALILFVLWCIGMVAKAKYRKKIQANTTSDKNVLSVIYLAKEVIDDRRYAISKLEIVYVYQTLSESTFSIESI